MWQYEKKLQYPVNIKTPNAKLAKVIISQLGGPDGELAASLRYLNQRYAMPYAEVKGLLTDIGTEELAHVEMISAILYQLTKDLSMDEIIYHLKSDLNGTDPHMITLALTRYLLPAALIVCAVFVCLWLLRNKKKARDLYVFRVVRALSFGR